MLSVRKTASALVPFPGDDSRDTTMPPVPAADRTRLARERAAAQAKLDAVDAELERLNAESGVRDAFDAEAPERLHVLAQMGPGLLAPLHAILGYADILRMDSSLTAQQFDQASALFAAASDLAGNVRRVLSLADQHENLIGGDRQDDQSAGLTEDAATPQAASSDTTAASVTSSLRVLIADDSAMNRDIAAAFLREAGHVVSLAESGAEAVSVAAAADLDAILMDVRMPDMDGLEATRRIRALPGAKSRVPIIALTTLSFAEDVELCNKAGMNGHLTKPFSRETLTQIVLRAVAPRAAPREILASGPSAPADPSGLAHMPASVASLPAPADIRSPRRVPGNPSAADSATSAWLDIDNPWNRVAQRPRSQAGQGSPAGLFDLKLTAITIRGKRRLFDNTRSCRPQAHQDQHGFHWLVFVPGDLEELDRFTAQCELWRWVRGTWSSTAVAGAMFTPDELYDQGWRYCGPCEQKAARIEITTKAKQAVEQ